MNQEEARAGKNDQRKGMQMGKVKHLGRRPACKKGIEKPLLDGAEQ